MILSNGRLKILWKELTLISQVVKMRKGPPSEGGRRVDRRLTEIKRKLLVSNTAKPATVTPSEKKTRHLRLV